jgi:hypothetical protein
MNKQPNSTSSGGRRSTGNWPFTPVPYRDKYTNRIRPEFILHHRDERPFVTVVGATRNGISVIDRANSHSHLDSKLLAEALGRVDMPAIPFAKIIVPMGRVVGESTCVETTSTDTILFARRKDRKNLTRFVKDRTPVPCSNIVVILKATKPGECVLITAFIGDHAEPEPWDPKATAQSRVFWQHHAMIWDEETVVPGTSTMPSL